MKRYLTDIAPASAIIAKTDVAIIGSGLAGLYAAYCLDRKLSCTIFTKQDVDDSSSSLAQGGIAAVTEKDDSFESHFQDTIKAGAGLCDEQAVRIIVEEGPSDIEALVNLGVDFDTDKNGHLLTAREGGHNMRRILRCGGDATGKEMVDKLWAAVSKLDNVKICEDAFALDVTTDNGEVSGIVILKEGRQHIYQTNQVIIATGGIGQIYRYTTNPSVATADGIALAQRAGAELSDMEFVQFHPTGLYTPKNRNNRCFLISEAVRGEGARLYNDAGERFMVGKHELCELAPRDIVSREIFRQIKLQDSPYVKLDITHKSEEFLKNRFPTIFTQCLKQGINMAEEFVPVGPVQHYFMGGVKTDLFGTTNVKGLYAIGEAASTGVHGANRLASNSTLECVVFGRRCAEYINEHFENHDVKIDKFLSADEALDVDTENEIVELKGTMVKYCGIIRNGYCLENFAIPHTQGLLSRLENKKLSSVREMELYNMAQIACEIAKSAFARKESVGSHCREEERIC